MKTWLLPGAISGSWAKAVDAHKSDSMAATRMIDLIHMKQHLEWLLSAPFLQ
jgi:hypothetical protein